MRGDRIPEADHVSRYCGGSHVVGDRISGTAFLQTEGHSFLSVNWLESLGLPNRQSEIREVCRILAAKRRSTNSLGATARIAVLGVQKVCDHVRDCSNDSRVLRVLHEPDPLDPSHAGIWDMQPDMELIADLIAETIAPEDIHPARV